MKHILSIILLAVLLACNSNAQEVKHPDSYNYKRGVEAFQNNNIGEALDYLNKELQEHADNGYALLWIAIIRDYQEEYGKALTAANLAIKYIPKNDLEYRSYAFTARGDIHISLEENDKALADYSAAIDTNPDDANSYEKRAELYFIEEKYDLSDKDYQQMISLDPGNIMGYMGIGRNAKNQERYEEAIKQFDYVIKLASDYASGYAFRAESYMYLKRYNEAMDDVIKALDIDNNRKAFLLMQDLADSTCILVTAKLKVQCNKSPENEYWPYCLGIVYEKTEQYRNAISYYKKSLSKKMNDVIYRRIANCLSEAGDYMQALEYMEQAILLDSTYNRYLMIKADIENNAGMMKEAIADLDRYILNAPDEYFGYYRRGWFKDNIGDIDGAIEDYTMAVTLEPQYAYAYMNRGILWKQKNNITAAKADFMKSIELDTIPDENSSAQYSYFHLGQVDKAKEWMNMILAKSDDQGTFYDAACLYSIMGENEQAISYLQQALEKGFRRFSHIERDRDLDNIRELPAFKALIEKYKQKHIQEIKELNDGEPSLSDYLEKKVEIAFKKEGNVFSVPCKVNNLPLHFIFDTGASDVSMSTVEATFMLKNGYLNDRDIIGTQNYMTATGEISEGTVVNLREVDFGGLSLNNIKASIVRNQKAPLLLGQSVLNRLGKIEIDNEKNVIKVTYKQIKQ